MSDSPDLSKRQPAGRLPPDVRAAHERLASLPTTRHTRIAVDRMAEVRRKGNEAAVRARKGILHCPKPRKCER